MDAAAFEALAAPLRGAPGAGLSVPGRTLRVHAEDQAAIDFLRGTFYPSGAFHVRVGPVGEAGADDLVFYDRAATPEELAGVAAAAARGAARRGSYQPVTGHWFDRYEAADGTVVFVDGKADAPGSLVIRRGNEILLLSRGGGEHPRRMTRVVRQVVGRILEDRRHIPFHASSFRLDGRAYLVIGDAGAGKSTLSVAMARFADDGAWIGNDRAYVDLSGAEMYTTACPLPLAVNKGSLLALEVDGWREWPLLEPVPDDSTDWAEYDGDAKMKLSPREVDRFLGARVCEGAPLGGVVFPTIGREGAPMKCEPTVLAAHQDVLRRNCLALHDNLYPEDWLGVRRHAHDVEAAFAEFLARASALPAWSVRTSAYADTRPLAALLAGQAAERARAA